MFAEFSLAEAQQFAGWRAQLDSDQLVTALGSNNSELKVLLQGPLVVGEPVPLTQIRHNLETTCNGNRLQPVPRKQVLHIFRTMPAEFIGIDRLDDGSLIATQTEAGRDQSASLGGHLANLAVEANTPLRPLVGDNITPWQTSETTTNHPIVTRLRILNTLWSTASKSWQPAEKLKKSFLSQDLGLSATKDHLLKLIHAGILERREPRRDIGRERRLNGYLYRLRQENGHMPPKEIVERYLAIVVLATALDPVFIKEGLAHLDRISHEPAYVPYLLRRSHASSAAASKAKTSTK